MPQTSSPSAEIDREGALLPLATPPDASPNRASPGIAGIPRALAERLSAYVALGSPQLRVIAARSQHELSELLDTEVEALVNVARVNDIRFINKFFKAVSRLLPQGGLLAVGFETLHHRRRRINARYPAGLAELYYLLTFLFHRVFSKLPLLKRLYFTLTRGYGRPLSRAEVLGRLCFCGFDIEHVVRTDGRLYVVARKARPPASNVDPSYGPLFAMRRVGRNGAPVRVYKLRTMHPYSEYLQEYVYERNSLAAGGKFRRDFRVTVWGHWLRRLWIDELPMLLNWIKGDLKLVGVRPLSAQYESLYPAELRERRRKVKPGLLPPFYADLPRTFDEIVASESRYLEEYERTPLRTDARYLLLALRNIVLKRARSH